MSFDSLITSIIVKKDDVDFLPILMEEVEGRIVVVRGQRTLLDRDVALLYGAETKRVNEAVKNNPRKFREGYVIELTKEESDAIRSKISTIENSDATLDALKSNNSTLESTSGKGRHSKYNFKAFTSKGLYMLATCLKSDRAADATVAIVETFDKVQTLKRELLELHKDTDKEVQAKKMRHFGEVLTDIVMPDLQTQETESTLEINFFIGKLKHTVKRVRKDKSKK